MKELGQRVVAVDRNAGRAGPRGRGRRRGRRLRRRRRRRRGRAPPRGRRRADRSRPTAPCRSSPPSRRSSACPGSAARRAHAMTHKVAMRHRLADAGVPQPRVRGRADAARGARGGRDGRLPGGAEAGRLGRPARALPARASRTTSSAPALGARGVADRRGDPRDVPPGARGERAARRPRRRACALITLSDRLRPAGRRLRRRDRARLPVDALRRRARGGRSGSPCATVRALGLRNGVAYPAAARRDDGVVRVIEVAARIPGGQMARSPRYGVGVDLVEVAVRQALGEDRAGRAARAALPAAARDPLPDRRARAAPARRASSSVGDARAGARALRASSRPSSTSSRARRSGRCRSTATGAAT